MFIVFERVQVNKKQNWWAQTGPLANIVFNHITSFVGGK
jgi:hypothetical protein